MRVVQIKEPNAPFELIERPMPEPGPREVRLKVEACGICHSDAFVVTGTFPGVHYPAVPGHEIAGRIDKLGPGITTWREGQRVGVGPGRGTVTLRDVAETGLLDPQGKALGLGVQPAAAAPVQNLGPAVQDRRDHPGRTRQATGLTGREPVPGAQQLRRL